MVEEVFREVFHENITETEAGIRLHHVCNEKGVNPAIESPITMLLLTEKGQKRLKLYEEFIMGSNWLVAKVSAHQMTITSAVSAFLEELEKITKQMLKGNS